MSTHRSGSNRAERERVAAEAAIQFGLATPTFVDAPEMTIAGLNAFYNAETRHNIPKQWTEFAPHMGNFPGQIDAVTSYGVSWNYRGYCQFDYLTGVEVKQARDLPEGFITVTIAPSRYAVFHHQGDVTTIPKALDAIYAEWLPKSEMKMAARQCIERYTSDFNPATMSGGIEFWIPVEG